MEEEFDPYTKIIVTEKMDGENTSVDSEGMHARSLDSRDHPSRHYVKGMIAGMQIPEGMTLLGENMYAQHSIRYTALESYFYLFGVRWDFGDSGGQTMLSWSHVVKTAERFGIPTVSVIWEGKWKDFSHGLVWPRTSTAGAECEGYVVRDRAGFRVKNFRKSVAKYVRSNHIQTDKHWMHQTVVPNKLKSKR
jgi:tRNA splicing ligase